MKFHQIFGIAKYEFIMGWRQRMIPVLTLSLMVLPLFFAFFIKHQLSLDTDSLNALLVPEAYHLYARAVTGTVQLFAWAAIYLILIVMAPLVLSSIIPKDRQLGVRDLLDGLPLTHGVYLNGKLLGGWVVVLTGLVVAMSIVVIGWRLILKAIYLPPILSTWLVGGSVITLVNTGLAMLLTAGESTRRRAYAITTALAFITLLFHVLSNGNVVAMQNIFWWEFFIPARAPLYLYYLFANMGLSSGLPADAYPIAFIRVWQTLLAGFIEIAVVWFMARFYVQTR